MEPGFLFPGLRADVRKLFVAKGITNKLRSRICCNCTGWCARITVNQKERLSRRKVDMSSPYPEYHHQQQAGLEVVLPETGLYPAPTPAPVPPVPQPPPVTHHPVIHAAPPKEYPVNHIDFEEEPQTPARTESQVAGSARRRILGLSVPVFWALIVTLVVVLAAGIGGGVGGGLSAQRKSASGPEASRFVAADNLFTSAFA